MQAIAVQYDIAWEDKAANFAKVRSLLAGAEIQRGALIVLPEMFAVGYTMNVEAAEEGERREAERFLAEIARRYEACVLGGVVTRDPAGKGRNEALAVGPDGRPLARYAKLYPTTPLGEPEHYIRGERAVTFGWGGLTVAPAICYDLRFADVFRAGLRQGADAFTVIASFPAARAAHWVKLLQARAIEQQAYIIGVNRCGRDPHHEYPGRSMIVDPWGEVLADAGDGEAVISADLDAAKAADYRRSLPFIEDLLRAEWRRSPVEAE